MMDHETQLDVIDEFIVLAIHRATATSGDAATVSFVDE